MNSEPTPWYMGYVEKDGETLGVFLEVPNGKSPEEIEEAFKKMDLFGFKFKPDSIKKVATK